MFSINITVIGLTVTKIKEFAGERMRIFAPVISELRLTIWYQIVMIAVQLLSLIICDSSAFVCAYPMGTLIINAILSAGLFYNIEVLRDTATAIFRLFDEESK